MCNVILPRLHVHRLQFSVRSLIVIISEVAILLTLWGSHGEYLLLLSFLICTLILALSIRASHQWLIPIRRYARIRLLLALGMMASLGPAMGFYTRYDPDWGTTPVLKKAYSTVYSPVGRTISFPSGPAKELYLRYLQLWTPDSTMVRDIGWGIKYQGKSDHLYLGL